MQIVPGALRVHGVCRLCTFGAAAPLPSDEAALEAYDARETTLILFELVDTLCPERRDVVVAYEVEGMPMSDVARAQGIPLNTAWNRLRLGREDLRSAWHRRAR